MNCLIYGDICDLFDGWEARRFNPGAAEKAFGLSVTCVALVFTGPFLLSGRLPPMAFQWAFGLTLTWLVKN